MGKGIIYNIKVLFVYCIEPGRLSKLQPESIIIKKPGYCSYLFRRQTILFNNGYTHLKPALIRGL